MNLRKGASIIHIRAFASERFGPDAWDNFIATMSEADRLFLSNIVSEGWYEMALHVRVNRAFCDFFYDGNLAGAKELGRYTAERELALSWRRILSLVRPSFAARHIGVYWRQEEGSGNWTSQMRGNEFVAQLSDWQDADIVLYRRLAGYLERMLEVAGTVTLLDLTCESRNGIPHCTFRFEWNIQRDVPLRERIESKVELAEVARELGLFTDVESLADAITELLHVQLGYSYVALWVRPVDCEGLTLIRDVGCARAKAPICVVLQRGGRIIGRLDVEPGPGAREELFIELIPLLALPLDATRLSGLQLGPERNFAERLIKARTKWGFTVKETDVLELLLRGRTNKEIADEVDCEPSTIEQHVSRILRKSGCKSRSELGWSFWTAI